MYDADDDSERITISPPLEPDESRLVGGLAGVGDGPRQVWAGQPGTRSPWLPCADGCCLVLEARPHAEHRAGHLAGGRAAPAAWLRFLIREVLAPRAAGPRARAKRVGLPGGHRLHGRVLLDVHGSRPLLVVVSSNRVREMPLDEDLFPLERPPRRAPGEVVPLERTTARAREGQRAER